MSSQPMNKTLSLALLGLLVTHLLFAQAPNKMSYQAVVRNSSNSLVINQAVGMRISILQGSANGTSVYTEAQTTTTNANGLASIEIGGGNVLSGNFAGINLANGPYFIKAETDPAGGTNYSITSTQQLLSVPYALYSATAGNGLPSGGSAGQVLTLCNGVATWTTGGQCPGSSSASCGATNVHNPNLTYGSMTDQDGNTYKTIIIGTQEWMAENLKASHYRNGDLIPVVTDPNTWAGLSSGATCWYNNDSAMYHCPYGKLYNWFAVTDPRNVCPTGWHVPTDAEWNVLAKQLDPAADTTCSNCTQSTIAGVKMKSTGTQYWTAPNTAADNSSGFSGLPGGNRYNLGTFDFIGDYGLWWSSSQDTTSNARYRSLDYFSGNLNRNYGFMRFGFSVRCLRD